MLLQAVDTVTMLDQKDSTSSGDVATTTDQRTSTSGILAEILDDLSWSESSVPQIDKEEASTPDLVESRDPDAALSPAVVEEILEDARAHESSPSKIEREETTPNSVDTAPDRSTLIATAQERLQAALLYNQTGRIEINPLAANKEIKFSTQISFVATESMMACLPAENRSAQSLVALLKSGTLAVRYFNPTETDSALAPSTMRALITIEGSVSRDKVATEDSGGLKVVWSPSPFLHRLKNEQFLGSERPVYFDISDISHITIHEPKGDTRLQGLYADLRKAICPESRIEAYTAANRRLADSLDLLSAPIEGLSPHSPGLKTRIHSPSLETRIDRGELS